MKIFDVIGNVIRKGDPLYFQALKTNVKVLDIQEPGVIDKSKPGFLSVELRIPITNDMLDKATKDVRFGDFIATRDPAAEANIEGQIDDILSGKGKRLSLAK